MNRKFETRALPELMEQRNNLMDELETLTSLTGRENRALTADEETRCNELIENINAIDRTLTAQEEVRRLEQREEKKKPSGLETRAAEEEKNFLSFIRGEKRALDVANNGAIVPETIANRIIEKVKELSPIYSMATIYNVGGNLVFPVYDETGDTGAGFVEDMKELEASSGKFTSISLENNIVGVLKLVSKSLMNRTEFDLMGFIVNKVAENISEFLEKNLLKGAENKCEGVFDTKNIVTAAAANKITADDLIDLQMKVPTVYQGKSCWIMNKETMKFIRKLKDNDGNYLLNKDIASPFGWSLLGKQVYISDNAPKIAAGETIIVYGDMSGLYVKLAQNLEIQILLEKYATQHAVGVCGYVEFDSKIVEKEKIAGLQMSE